jgi:uncharacterized damage-inducible protein DinB
MYAFNQWANHRVLSDASSLTKDDFSRNVGTSHMSVQGTLVHILWAEWLWLRRWDAQSPKQVFTPTEYADVRALETEWKNVEYEQQRFLAELTDEKLATQVAYKNLQGQRWEYSLGQMMQHVVNHSSYHRGQVVTLLRQMGQAPQATDLLVFFDETGGAGAA